MIQLITFGGLLLTLYYQSEMEALLYNFYRGKKVLVAGASGFIGKNLVLKLNKMGASVKGSYLNNKPNLDLENVKFVKCDFTSSADCLKATKDMDYVFMCSANSSELW